MPLQERNAGDPARAARARVGRLDWDLVRVFLDVARAGRLTAAAGPAGLDVSTVSRRLDRLERELGVRLFERAATGVRLTAAGQRLVPAAEDMARSLGELGVALAAVEAEAEGVVRLTAPPGVIDGFVAPALPRFHARHPRVRRPERGDLIAQRLVATPTVPATSPAYARALGTLRRIGDARWIAWGHDLAHIPDARWLTTYVDVPPVLRTSSIGAQLAAAAAGLGVTLAPQPYLARFGLAAVKPGRALAAAWAALPVGELWLVGHVAQRRVPRIAALWDFIVGELAGASDS